MPEICVYLNKDKGRDNAETSLLNSFNYNYKALCDKELRITFMRGLGTERFIFLGVYALDAKRSDPNHNYWKRVATRIDLDDLAQLEQLRKKVYP